MTQGARSFDDLDAMMNKFISPAGLEQAMAFRPRSTDVIISTYAKAGTTWMQQILHSLRTHGDMDFSEITEVTPWIELAYDCGWDLQADHKGEPRAFKSHLDGTQLPQGCRYINVIRDPHDTMVSLFNFFNGWFLARDALSVDAFTDWVIDRGPPFTNYWDHLLSWWHRRHERDLLMMAFEAMKEDLPAAVRRVADFIGLGHDEEAIAITIRQSSFEFMKANESRFDDHLIVQARNPALGLPPEAHSSKIKTGTIGGRAALAPESVKRLNEQWARIVEPVTGAKDYDALRAALG